MITIQPLQLGWGNIVKTLRLNSALEGSLHDADRFAPLIAELQERSNEEWNRIITDYLSEPSRLTLIAFDNRMPGGMITCHLEPRDHQVSVFDLIWVNMECRRREMGLSLLAAATKWSGQQGAKTIETWISEGNKASVFLHEKFGFVAQSQYRDDASNPANQEQHFIITLERSQIARMRPVADHPTP